MARPDVDDCEAKEEEALDEEMEALQSSDKLTVANPNQIKLSSIITTSSLEMASSRGSDVEEEDDSETLGAIEKRFAMYGSDCPIKNLAILLSRHEFVHTTSTYLENEVTNILSIKKPAPEALDKASTDPQQARSYSQSLESIIPLMSSGYPNPNTINTFFRVIKKNRSYQTCIRIKLVKIKAMVEELKEHIRIHKKFKLFSNTKTGRAAYLKKDVNALLVSVRKSTSSHNSKVNDKKLPFLFNGPVENSQVANYRMALMKFPVSLHRKKWSEKDKENLRRGIEQQFQEMLFQKSVELYSGTEEFSGDSNTLDNNITSISDIEITPEKIRSFIPKVDWQRLASMYAFGRSGAECEARWVNNDDPLINHNSWGNTEDKELISIVQKRGIYNWNEIAATLGTNRTPFQCLARYQRSLNCHIMKQEWTAEDDAQLCEAVKACGEHDWQQIASKLERRTGAQCSNRWMKTLNPARERVGRWTVEEDRHLKVAVMLFKPKMWHKIAQFVPGRTQVQCRERWVNVLDPSLNLQEWTEEEDTKLKAAIVEHGHCWSKVAASVAPRTDNQCRRRWKILLPREVPLLQAARRIKKSSLITNFVDREDERPGLSTSDFLTLSGIDVPEAENGSSSIEKNTKSCTIPNKAICEKSPSEAPLTCKEAAMMIDDDTVEPFGGDDSVSKNTKTNKLELKRKRCTEPAHVLNQELPVSPQASILSRTTVGFDTVKFASDATSLKKKTHKPRGHGDDTRVLQDGSVLAVYLESSRTDGPKGNNKFENVLLSKRRKVPKRPSKRNKSTASAKHQDPLSPELPTISRMTAQENQCPSITQTETISPRKMQHVLEDSLMMISSNSYDVSGSESGDEQHQIGDGNRASFLHLDTAQTNEELDINRRTLMEVNDIIPDTNNGTGNRRFSVCQGHHTYGEPDAAAHTQEEMITTGSSMAGEPDKAAHTEKE